MFRGTTTITRAAANNHTTACSAHSRSLWGRWIDGAGGQAAGNAACCREGALCPSCCACVRGCETLSKGYKFQHLHASKGLYSSLFLQHLWMQK